MSDEQQPDPIAQLDQTLRTLIDLAKMIHGYHCGLVAAGFTEDQALALTIAYQTAVVQAGRAG